MNRPEQKAQIARVNRALNKHHLKLCTSRGVRVQSSLGSHYVLDTYRNLVIDYHLKLENLDGDYIERIIEKHGWAA